MAVSCFNYSSVQSRWSPTYLQQLKSRLLTHRHILLCQPRRLHKQPRNKEKVKWDLSGTNRLLAEERWRQIIAFLALCDPVMLQCSQVPRVVLGLYTLRSLRTDTAKTCKFWQWTIWISGQWTDVTGYHSSLQLLSLPMCLAQSAEIKAIHRGPH